MNENSMKFENSNILKLQEERVKIQKKTFTKWMNCHLKRASMEVQDIFVDLADGKVLLKLMEVISDAKLGKPNRGVLRVQKIENVNKALKYIQSKVTLENIGAEDIVDGNQRLILGLIWTIILRFQIQEMIIENESGEKKSAKDALLLWCQRKTHGYKNVEIKDFSKSWRNGMAFNALIHAHCPDLIDYDRIVPEQHQKNLSQAFYIADKELGVPNLLDPEDVDVDKPDDKSILTYVSSLYLTFAKMKTENTGAKRIGKIMANALEVSQMIEQYEKLVRDLLQWILRKITELNNRNFPNSLAGMQTDMQRFKQYRTIEKPPKFVDRTIIDEKLFQIIIKQKQNQMKTYVPTEGLLLKEVEVAWDNLEKAEHSRELSLRAELVRQEKLQQAAEKFKKKSNLRESWLNDILSILSKMDSGSTIQNIEAQINKEELIGNDISHTKERFQKLGEIARSLQDNNYYDKEMISQRNDDIQRRWQNLLTLMATKQLNSGKLRLLITILRNIHTLRLEFDDLYPQIKSTEFGKHLMAAEDLLERHNLLDRQLKTLSDRFKKVQFSAFDFLQSPQANTLSKEQRDTVETNVNNLSRDIDGLLQISKERHQQLSQNCNFHKLWSDLEEEEVWQTNQINVMASNNVGRDLQSVLRQIRRHQVYVSEIEAHRPIFERLKESGIQLADDYPLSSNDIRKRIEFLSNGWNELGKAKSQRGNLLKDAHECQRYYSDADDAEQWITEHFPLMLNKENGEDAGTSRALAKRHDVICEEITTFGRNDMKRLSDLATLMTKPSENHNITPKLIALKAQSRESIDNTMNIVNNMIQVPVEEESEYDTEENEEDDDELMVAISNYEARDESGRDISLVKDEAYKVLKKRNNEWWLVETKNHKKGHAPANYLKPQVKIRKPISKRKVIVNKWVPIDSDRARNYMAKTSRKSVNEQIFTTPQSRNENELHYDKDNIEKRQVDLERQYQNLSGLAKARAINLAGSTLCHQFLSECSSFEIWMKEKELAFNQRDSMVSDVEGTKKKYETIIDELAANSGRINDINELVAQLNKLDLQSEPDIAKLNSQLLAKVPFSVDKKKVDQRHRDIKNQWDQLNKLKCEKERSLAGASSIDLFNKTGDELIESMQQKIELLDDNDIGFDKGSNEALKRKFNNILREIEPIKERMEKFKYLGEGVKNTYPSEKKYVDDKLRVVQDLQNELQEAIDKRNSDLNNASNFHKFVNDRQDIDDKLDNLRGMLDNPIIPKDVQSVESCIQQHQPLKYEIETSDKSIAKLEDLAKCVLRERPNDQNVTTMLYNLKEKLESLKKKEENREKDLNDALIAQKFYKECDQVELLISQQACKLDAINPQVSVDDVERALKNYDNLTAIIVQLNNRIINLADRRKELLLAKHPSSEKISSKVKNLDDKMTSLHNKCSKKKMDLENDFKFAKFKENADELNEWIDDKMLLILDNNYKDLHNISEKLQKHRGLDAEIKANLSAVEDFMNSGKKLIKEVHPKKDIIEDILNKIHEKWQKLDVGADDKERKLIQAREESEFNEEVTEIMNAFNSIDSVFKSTQMGNDLTSSKNLLGKHHDIENLFESKKEKLDRLKEKANAMQKDGHFDKNKILDSINKLEIKCTALNPIAKQRRKSLENNLKWHKFAFDVDQELQWIDEHRPLATLNDCGRSLDDSVKLGNKHKKLLNEINGHTSVITNLLSYGSRLADDVGPTYKKDIDTRCKELKEDWQRLQQQAENRQYNLELTEEGRQLFNDCGEIDIWITEKSYLVNQSDQNLDMDHLINRLTKLKSTNIDLGTYETLLKNINEKVNVFKTKCNKSKLLPELVEGVERRYNDVSDKFYSLKDLLNKKQKSLENSRDFQNYQTEVTDIESWIDEKLRIADNNEFGEDLQQMEHLKERWNNQLTSIEAGKDRIAACNNVADDLIKNRSPNILEIEGLQDDLNTEWNRLLQVSVIKNSKFDSANEIHRFNKMCKDLSDLMDLDNISVPSIYCKDRNALNLNVKRYETFEHELDNIMSQFLELKETARQLKEKYPNNAKFIQLEVDNLEEMWIKLRNFTDNRFAQLQCTMSYFDLCDEMKLARELFRDINNEIKAPRNINTVLAAMDVFKLAKEFKEKLVANEDYYRTLVYASETLISKSECSQIDEIQKAIDDILEEKSLASDALDKWIDHSQNIVIEQKVLKDIEQINSSSTFQEAKIKENYNTLDLEETEKLLNENRNLSYNINVTDERLMKLSEYMEELKKKEHFNIKSLSDLFIDCTRRRHQLHDHYGDVEDRLMDQLSWLKYLRETDDLKFWIDEKLQQIKTLDKSATNLEEKLHLLQKYKAFDAEVTANTPEFVKLSFTVTNFVKNKHSKSKEIKDIYDNISTLWNKLLTECELRSTTLKETKDLLVFLDELDTVEAWFREKEFLVSANELGTDLDHCESLQAKLIEPVGGKQMDNERIRMIAKDAESLLKQKTIPQSEAENVKSRTNSIETRWKTLSSQLETYKMSLEEAHKMHKYYNDLCLLGDQINDRLKMVKVNDLGNDVSSVEKLKRRQDAIGRDIVVLNEKYEALKNQDSFSNNLDVSHSMRISLKQKEIKDNLEDLTNVSAQRADLLNFSQRFFRIERDTKLLIDLSKEQMKEINDAGWPTTVKTAKEALKVSENSFTDMNARKIKEKRVFELCSKLKVDRDIVMANFRKDITVIPTDLQLNNILDKLAECSKEMQTTWKIKNNDLLECLDLHTFLESCELENQWLSNQDKRCEALLNFKDSVVFSVEDANERIEAKKSLDSIVLTREKKIIKGTLLEALDKLKQNKIKELTMAEDKYQGLLNNLNRIKDILSKISQSLTSEREFQELLQKVSDHISWIRNKTVIASDSNYDDKINLLNKIKKHKEFMSEVKANEPDIYAVIECGKGLLKGNNTNLVEIETNIFDLEGSWINLLTLGDFKLRRLVETSEEVIWSRKVEDFITWLDSVENTLESHDYGCDIISVEIFKKKLKNIEVDIDSHKEQLRSLEDQADKMIKKDSYLSEDIISQKKLMVTKFTKLSEFLKNYEDNLTDSQIFYQFTSDINYEFDWIQDKMRLTKKTELGSSLTEAIRFESQHHSLMTEIKTRSTVITSIIERGKSLEARSHFAVEKIRPLCKDLETSYQSLCRSSESRATDLSNNMAYQEFDGGMKDFNLRMIDKISMLNNLELGNDEQSCQQLIKKIDGIKLEIDSESNVVGTLHSLANQLADKYRPQAKESVKSLDCKLEDISEIITVKRNNLTDNIKYYQFVREAEEFLEWIKYQNSLVLTEDYGNDYDDCVNLLENVVAYSQTLNANSAKLTSLKNTAKQLLMEKNPFSQNIERINSSIITNMTELRDNFKIRKEALQGALEVHLFTQESNDLVDWIKNKNMEISSLKQTNMDKVNDLELIEARSDRTDAILGAEFYQPLSVIRNIESDFNKFERDLEAVKVQIGKFDKESIRLQNEYPDATNHINEKKIAVEKIWNKLNIAVRQKKGRLSECKQLQLWLNQYKDLLSWAKAQNTKITSEDTLPNDVDGAHRILDINSEYKNEIDSKLSQLNKLMEMGEDIKNTAKYITVIMEEKMTHLKKVWQNMCDNLKSRRNLYEQNLDLRKFLLDVQSLEKWLVINENKMNSIDIDSFKNITDIQGAVKNHDDFMKYIAAEQARFDAIKRLTKLEDMFKHMLILETKETDSIWSNDVTQNIKRRETQRILQERSKDIDRRKADEAILRVNSSGRLNATPPEVTDVRTKKLLKKQASLGQLDIQSSPVKIVPLKLKIASVEEEEEEVLKPVKKITSFSTKKRDLIKDDIVIKSHSLKSPSMQKNCQISGNVTKKQLKSSHGIKASVRSWKEYFAVLNGYTLKLFKDKNVYQNQANDTFISHNIKNATFDIVNDHDKRSFLIHVKLEDSSEFYLQLQNTTELKGWMKILSKNSILSFEDEMKIVEVQESLYMKKDLEQLSSPIDVSKLLDEDLMDSKEIRDSNGLKKDLNVNIDLPKCGVKSMNDTKITLRRKEGLESQGDRPMTEMIVKDKKVPRQQSYTSSVHLEPRSLDSKISINKSPPVPLSIIRSKQLSLESKKKSATLPIKDSTPKTKSISLFNRFKRKEGKSDEV